ncbi:MAG: Lrp/AsnC family transcriptional regulator [Thermoplasmatota archaeon]
MKDSIDDIDKKIISNLCDGINSYKDLAEKLGLSRNTVYRRMKILKEKGVIREEIKIIPDIDKLGYTFITLSINLGNKKYVDEVIDLYNEHEKVTMILETFGHHDIILIAICDDNKTGELVKGLEKVLTDKDIPVKKFEVSSGIKAHKLKFTPDAL